MTDLRSAVKELVENSIDAGSTSIDVKFIQNGLLGFEVTDNGCGIAEADFESLCKRGTTSKITKFEDIYTVESLGFRGEALSSLCNLGTVTINTKQQKDNTSFLLQFDMMGNLVSKQKH